MLPRQKWDKNLTIFVLIYFFSVNKQISIITKVMQTQAKVAFALLKLILNFFSGEPKLLLTPKVSLSPNTKK